MNAGLISADQVKVSVNEFYGRIQQMLASKVNAFSEDKETRGKSIAAIRWKLVRILREYQLFKHNAIFNPLIEKGSESEAAYASHLKRLCTIADDQHKDHVRRWSLVGSEQDWTTHEQDLQKTVDAVLSTWGAKHEISHHFCRADVAIDSPWVHHA